MTGTKSTPEFTSHNADMESYRAGKFVYTADGKDVLVTKDDGPSIITIALYTYKNHDAACDAAWKMATKQMKS